MRLPSLLRFPSLDARFFVGLALFLLFVVDVFPQAPKGKLECKSISFTIALKQGESFQRRVGNLTFKIQPLKGDWGWMFFLENANGEDFLYAVNPPFHFNSSTTLGRGYGETAKRSLTLDRNLRFVLSQSQYDYFRSLVANTQSGSKIDPEQAAKDYFAALAKASLGMLHLRILKSDVGADDSVQSAEFQIEFLFPSAFVPDPSLKLDPAPCPTKEKFLTRHSHFEASGPVREIVESALALATRVGSA